MVREIHPLGVDDLADVGQFLAEGFRAPADAEFASADVLRWKFFDPRGGPEVPRAYVAREDGRIVGFVGISPGTFHVSGQPDREITTLHGIDWLSGGGRTNTGAYLFLRGHRGIDTAYVLGASDDARRVIAGGGYEETATVPVYGKTLRPFYRLRDPGGAGGLARAVRDAFEGIRHRAHQPTAPVVLRRVEAFGPEIDAMLGATEPGVVFTRRHPDLLNHLLRYPGKTLSGWAIERGGRMIGFGLLAVIPKGPTRVGKIVECFLPGRDPADWHAAIDALTRQLGHLGADLALACGSTEWTAKALRAAGYRERYRLSFSIRDRSKLLPRDLPFHLTFLEADYAYLA
jgi:hypothetical protein